MSFIDDDLDALFGDLSVPVSFGSQTGRGILDEVGHDLGIHVPGAIQATEFCVMYKTTAFSPAPKPTDSITVDGVSYIVRNVDKLDDGKITKAYLKTK